MYVEPKDDSVKKKKKKQQSHEIITARSDDLREVVTETVTKLLADDVLELDEDGQIDIKKPKSNKKNKMEE